MATLTLSNEQVMDLVKQLPMAQQQEIFQFLLLQQWEAWETLARYGAEKARLAAQDYGLDWETMTEEEKEAFIDDVVHDN